MDPKGRQLKRSKICDAASGVFGCRWSPRVRRSTRQNTYLLCVVSWILLTGWCSVAWSVPQTDSPNSVEWESIPPIPDATGLAGPFAGIVNGELYVGGGANFPEAPPWEGGNKVWHDRIWAWSPTTGRWRAAGKLPAPMAYGVAVTIEAGMVCVGGSDSRAHTAEVFLMRDVGGEVQFETWPELPIPLAGAAGTLVGRRIVVAGGSSEPGEMAASSRVFSIDIDRCEQGWTELPPLPASGRIMATAATLDGKFYLVGGAALEQNAAGVPERVYLREAWQLVFAGARRDWRRIADLPRPVVAAPSPAPAVGPNHFVIVGGDDGSQTGVLPAMHRGFVSRMLAWHSITDTWSEFGDCPAPRVTVPVVPFGGGWVIPSGEMRPGVRSPEVWKLTIARRPPAFGIMNQVVLVVYLILVFVVGILANRGGTTTEQFFRAGQRIPWWAAGMSIFATLLSSITFMSIPAQGYSVGWNLYLQNSFIVLIPVVILVFLPFYRRLNVTSAYEYLEQRFSVSVRWIASVQFMLFQMGRIAVVLLLPAIALSTVAGMDLTVSVVVVGILCVVYTMFGGMAAVIWTDVVQTLVLMGGALWALVSIVASVEGGVAGIWEIAREHDHFFGTVPWSWDVSVVTGWVILLGSVFNNLFSYTASQDVVQRYLTTADERSAARAIGINALMAPLAQAMFFAIGTGLFAFYSQHPGRVDVTLANDTIFPWYIVHEMPAGVAGLLVAAIFAASQSTISSSLNSIATAFVTDFAKRLRPGYGDRRLLRIAQGVTVVVGLAGIGGALWLGQSGEIKSLWETFLAILGLFGGTISGMFLLGIFVSRANSQGALAGSVASAAAVFAIYWFQILNFWWYGFVGIAVCVVVGSLASLLFPAPAGRGGPGMHRLQW